MTIDLSKIRQALMGRKDKSSFINMAYALLVAYLVTERYIDHELGLALIASGGFGAGMSIWGTAYEDAAKKKNGGGAGSI